METRNVAWFVCSHGGVVDDVALPLKAGIPLDSPDIAKQGRMRAARVFKRQHGLHPCTRVDVDFQAAMPAAEYDETL